MLDSSLSWDDTLRLVSQEYETIFQEEILSEIRKAILHISSYLQVGVRLPGRLPLKRTIFKSRGIGGAVFFVRVYVKDLIKDDNNLRITVVAKFKSGHYTNYIAYTGDPHALYWNHFFKRYLEREGIENDVSPEMLYLDILSDESMWLTACSTYKHDKYGDAYLRPWNNGVALGTTFHEGELRGTYISRDLMRKEQDIMCEALVYMGEIQRLYGYRLEDNMERTMLKYDSGSYYADQIIEYFICFWQTKRIAAFFENDLEQFDRKTELVANRFFEKYDLPINYRHDCMVPLKRPKYYDESAW